MVLLGIVPKVRSALVELSSVATINKDVIGQEHEHETQQEQAKLHKVEV